MKEFNFMSSYSIVSIYTAKVERTVQKQRNHPIYMLGLIALKMIGIVIK
jgi:hypothetical protein